MGVLSGPSAPLLHAYNESVHIYSALNYIKKRQYFLSNMLNYGQKYI